MLPMPISHPLVRPRRAAAVRTNAAIDASLSELAQSTRFGVMKKNSEVWLMLACLNPPLALRFHAVLN